jgi:2-polyprenyl-6-methoxyphenol hydroxylase-like FAD-dependent oxidoreductase
LILTFIKIRGKRELNIPNVKQLYKANMADVLVVGAGPTGLFMAIELVRQGLSVRIVEKNRERSRYSKALAIQPRTLEILHHVGLIDPFLQHGIRVRAFNPMGNPMQNQSPLGHLCLGALDTPYPFILSIEQSKTEQFLEEHLASLGVKVERGIEIASLQVAEPWVIGCDGIHSTVRKLLNLSFEGREFPSTFFLADVRIEWTRSHNEAYGFLTSKGIVAAIPLPQSGYYRLVSASGDLREMQKLLPDASISDPIWEAQFHIHTRMVSSYQKGKVFLAGDAAHVHSPVGGQGMNSGMQDAFNLAWKLALVHRGLATDRLLATYHLERHFFGKTLLKGTEIATHLIALRSPFWIRVRNWIFKKIFACPWIRRKITSAVAQLSIHYPESAIVKEVGSFRGGPSSGMRPVNAVLFGPDGEIDLFSLWQKTTEPQVVWFVGKKKIKVPYGIQIVDSPHPMEGVYVDPVGNAYRAYGVAAQAVYIIRPDRVVGYRSTSLNAKKVADYLRLV